MADPDPRALLARSVSPVAALLVLGVGRAGAPGALDYLLSFFHTARGQLAWAAADALLVAAPPRSGVSDEEAERVRTEVIEGLITEYPASHSDAERRRRLYVLGFLKRARPGPSQRRPATPAIRQRWAGRSDCSPRPAPPPSRSTSGWTGWVRSWTAPPPWDDEWAQKRLISLGVLPV